MGIATAICSEVTAPALYAFILEWAKAMKVSETLLHCIQEAESRPPAEFSAKMGWVLIAFGMRFIVSFIRRAWKKASSTRSCVAATQILMEQSREHYSAQFTAAPPCLYDG